jgi:carnosine N-methyltransferase
MVCSFYRLFENDIDFFQINAKKVFRKEDTAILMKASLPKGEEGSIPSAENLTYFLGDALHAPLPDASQAAVISAYFTDVFPLHQYMNETARVLKPGGLLIHFGPLEYHFNEIEHMLSADEIRQALKEFGFTILHEGELENSHLKTAESMAQNIYRNWFFTARKESTEEKNQLPLPQTRIALADGIAFDIHGQLYPKGERIDSITVYKSNSHEHHQISRPIFDLLKLVDGLQNTTELIDAFIARYEVPPELREDLHKTIIDLFHKGILKAAEEGV